MILNITHNDLDGISCGILIKKCFPSADIIYTGYDEFENILHNIPEKYSTVIITDLGPEQSSLEMLAGEKEVILIDHHKSTLKLKKYPFVYHGMDACAAKLTYKYLTSKGFDLKCYENYVDCVNDFDLWIMKREDSLKMNILLQLLGTERFEKRFFEEPYTKFNETEILMITLEEEKRDAYFQRAIRNISLYRDKNNRTFAFIFAEQYASELGNYILMQSSVDYVLLVNAQRKKASLRSVDDVDVSLLAERNGGGGHKNAAGFAFDTDFCVSEMLQKAGFIK